MAIRSRSAQDFVPIREIRDGVVVLKDGSIRAVLMASSINFALKSEDEQQATLMQFQNFLNSLEFSVQFFSQSKRLDIRPYLAVLTEREKEQPSDIMRIQTHEYVDFVKSFVDASNIMTKTFFVVIPYTPKASTMVKQSNFRGMFGKKDSEKSQQNEADAVEEHRSQLEQRISVVEQGLTRTGVRVAQLGTEEIIELFYKMFNPGELEKPITING